MKNICMICSKPVNNKNGVQCYGSCKNWAHFKCLNFSPEKISDIKRGKQSKLCPCPDCTIRNISKPIPAPPPHENNTLAQEKHQVSEKLASDPQNIDTVKRKCHQNPDNKPKICHNAKVGTCRCEKIGRSGLCKCSDFTQTSEVQKRPDNWKMQKDCRCSDTPGKIDAACQCLECPGKPTVQHYFPEEVRPVIPIKCKEYSLSSTFLPHYEQTHAVRPISDTSLYAVKTKKEKRKDGSSKKEVTVADICDTVGQLTTQIQELLQRMMAVLKYEREMCVPCKMTIGKQKTAS